MIPGNMSPIMISVVAGLLGGVTMATYQSIVPNDNKNVRWQHFLGYGFLGITSALIATFFSSVTGNNDGVFLTSLISGIAGIFAIARYVEYKSEEKSLHQSQIEEAMRLVEDNRRKRELLDMTDNRDK